MDHREQSDPELPRRRLQALSDAEVSRLVIEPSSDESDSGPVLDDIEQQTDERASDEDVLYAYVSPGAQEAEQEDSERPQDSVRASVELTKSQGKPRKRN